VPVRILVGFLKAPPQELSVAYNLSVIIVEKTILAEKTANIVAKNAVEKEGEIDLPERIIQIIDMDKMEVVAGQPQNETMK
jgi:hypothetical protein